MAKQKPIDLSSSLMATGLQPLNLQLIEADKNLLTLSKSLGDFGDEMGNLKDGFSKGITLLSKGEFTKGFSMIGELPKAFTSSISNLLKGGLGTVLKGVATVGGKIGAVIAVVGTVAVKGFEAVKKTVLGAFDLMINGALKLGQTVKGMIGSYVQDFAPANVEMFDRVLKDISATVGEVLLPVMEGFRHVLRFLGDTMAGIAPVFKGMIAIVVKDVKPGLTLIGGEFRELMKTVGHALQIFGGGTIKVFGAIFKYMSNIFAIMIRGINNIIKMMPLLNALPNPFENMDFTGASVGKSAGQGSTSTVSAMLSQIQAAGFGAAKAAAQLTADSTKKTADNTGKTQGTLEDLFNWMQGLGQEQINSREEMRQFFGAQQSFFGGAA